MGSLWDRLVYHFWFEAPVQSQLYFDGWLWAFGCVGFILAVVFATQFGRRWKTGSPLCTVPRGSRQGITILASSCFLGLLIGFASFQELHSHYFALLSPFLALLGASAMQSLALWLRMPLSSRTSSIAITVLFFLALTPVARQGFARAAWETEQTEIGGTVPYRWIAEGDDWMTRIVHDRLWRTERRKGISNSTIEHYLWSKRRAFSTAEKVAKRIQSHVSPNETIMGASSIAPLVALLSDRKLAGHEADTNSKRISSGLSSARDWAELACRENVRLVVGSSRSYFAHRKMTRHPYWSQAFRVREVIQDEALSNRGSRKIILYERTSRKALCSWGGEALDTSTENQ